MVSLKKLVEHFGEEKGNKIRDLLTKKSKTTDYASVIAWEKQCYHRPRYQERLMVACNEILEGYGLEVIPLKNGEIGYEYVNLGDAYTTTLILKIGNQRVFIDSFGDLVERCNL